MIRLKNTEIRTVEKMLDILRERVGFYQKDGDQVYYTGLCSLINSLTINTQLIKNLYSYLPSYTGPKEPIGSTFWFSSRNFEFFNDRIQFLEYVLKQNPKDI